MLRKVLPGSILSSNRAPSDIHNMGSRPQPTNVTWLSRSRQIGGRVVSHPQNNTTWKCFSDFGLWSQPTRLFSRLQISVRNYKIIKAIGWVQADKLHWIYIWIWNSIFRHVFCHINANDDLPAACSWRNRSTWGKPPSVREHPLSWNLNLLMFRLPSSKSKRCNDVLFIFNHLNPVMLVLIY